MYQKNQTKKSILRPILVVVLSLVGIAAALVILEKTGVTNFYSASSTPTPPTQQITGEIPSANPTNTIDYSPPNPDNAVVIPDKNPNPLQPIPTNPELSIVMTNSRKSGDDYLIKAVIAGTDSATCSVTMTKGSLTASASSGATTIEGQYSCDNLFIPMSQLTESGEWNIAITVTDKAGAKASTNEKVIL